jgi:hypothetical protein
MEPELNHETIEERGMIDLYHRGLLPPEDEERFEAHFVGCPQCMEQLEMARGFQRGLKAAGTGAALAAVQAGLFAWLARRRPLVQWGLSLAVLLLAAGLPALWLLSDGRRTAAAAQAEAERWRRQAASAGEKVAQSEKRLAESERRRDEERRALESRLAQTLEPLVNTPVFLLSTLRGDETAPVIDLTRTGPALALAVDTGGDPRFTSYRAALTGPRGERVFRRSDLRPNALEVLLVTFPASTFSPGEHRLRVEGLRADGRATELGSYRFRVTGKP